MVTKIQSNTSWFGIEFPGRGQIIIYYNGINIIVVADKSKYGFHINNRMIILCRY